MSNSDYQYSTIEEAGEAVQYWDQVTRLAEQALYEAMMDSERNEDTIDMPVGDGVIPMALLEYRVNLARWQRANAQEWVRKFEDGEA